MERVMLLRGLLAGQIDPSLVSAKKMMGEECGQKSPIYYHASAHVHLLPTPTTRNLEYLCGLQIW